MGSLLKIFATLVGLILLTEFGLRLSGYHLTVKYRREGDLLFAPVPNQEVIEKIALTPTRVNNYGVRGADFEQHDFTQRSVVLCLGDSIVYGYGVSDKETYPDFIQKTLDAQAEGRHLVVNAGVNAYPVALMKERYLNLLALGITPEVVIIGYSMNEGLLGRIAEGDEALKSAFEKRIILKNTLRSIALYNLVVENWARVYYDRYKARFIPGTNQVTQSENSDGDQSPELKDEDFYAQSLAKLAKALKENGQVKTVIAVCSAGHNAETETYDTQSPFQNLFKKSAQEHGWILVENDDLLNPHAEEGRLEPFFIDRCHMNARGNEIVGSNLGRLILQEAQP